MNKNCLEIQLWYFVGTVISAILGFISSAILSPRFDYRSLCSVRHGCFFHNIGSDIRLFRTR